MDRIITRSNSKKKRQRPELGDQYRYICPQVTFDYMEHKSCKEYPLTLRVASVKINEGTYENVITNLTAEDFSTQEIKMLYHMRREIETSFRELKHILGTCIFHSKQRKHIEQEIWARFILYNFCAIITVQTVMINQV